MGQAVGLCILAAAVSIIGFGSLSGLNFCCARWTRHQEQQAVLKMKRRNLDIDGQRAWDRTAARQQSQQSLAEVQTDNLAWYFKDPQGKEQGPFDTYKMR